MPLMGLEHNCCWVIRGLRWCVARMVCQVESTHFFSLEFRYFCFSFFVYIRVCIYPIYVFLNLQRITSPSKHQITRPSSSHATAWAGSRGWQENHAAGRPQHDEWTPTPKPPPPPLEWYCRIHHRQRVSQAAIRGWIRPVAEVQIFCCVGGGFCSGAGGGYYYFY